MSIRSEPETEIRKKWSPLTRAYAEWLFPLMNRQGHGFKWKGSPRHCNEREAILEYRARRRPYLHTFSKPKLEQHGQPGYVYYFTGSRTGEKTLVMIDVDTHAGEPDGLRFVQHLLTYFPGAFHQTSTTGRGYHVYLILDTQGIAAPIINVLYKKLEKWLEREAGGYRLSAVEVKGHIQHGDDPTGWYCGQLAKIPIVKTTDELERLKATWTATTVELVTFLETRNAVKPEANPVVSIPSPREGEDEKRIQNYLRGTFQDKASKEQDLTPKKAKPVNKPISKEENCTARRMKAAWDYIRRHQRLPDADELLAHIRAHDYFSPPWTYNEHKRRQDVIRIIAKVSQGYKSKSPTTDHSEWAKELLEGHELTYGEDKKVTWTDLAIFLALLDYTAHQNPNGDGSIPKKWFESLWAKFAKRLGYDRTWDNKKNKVIREFLIALDVITMVNRSHATNRAMRWTIGPSHPQYGKVNRIVLIPLSDDIHHEHLLDDLQRQSA